MTHDVGVETVSGPDAPAPDGGGSVAAVVHGHVAAQLKKLRLANGITQTEMGEVLQLTYLQVHKYERGLSRVPLERIWLAAEHFGLEISYFFDGLESAARPRVARSEDDDKSELRLALSQAVQLIRSPKTLRSLLHLTRALTLVAEAAPHE